MTTHLYLTQNLAMTAVRFWRMLNFFALLVAFFAPWVEVYSDWLPSFLAYRTISGWRVIFNDITFAMREPLAWGSSLYSVFITVGHLCFAAYTFVSLIWTIDAGKHLKGNWRRGLLITIAASALILLEADQLMWSAVLAWGYWLACVGLLASLVLEAVEAVLLNIQAG